MVVGGFDVDGLSKMGQIVLRANNRIAAKDWLGLERLDAELAQARAGSLLFGRAVRARVLWRLAVGGEADGRDAIERAVPHGRTDRGGRGDRGSWSKVPTPAEKAWRKLERGYRPIIAKYPKLDRGRHIAHLGTLGSGNHFIEL